MTAEELIRYFNEAYGIKPWPRTYGVDPTTYANVCQYVFDKIQTATRKEGIIFIELAVGPNRGIMLKNVEIVIEGRPIEPRTAKGDLD